MALAQDTGGNMTRPVQVTVRNMGVSLALEQNVRARADWLDTFCPGIIGCRVVLDMPHRHRQHGRPVHVWIEVSLPGEDVIVNHEPADHAIPRQKSEEVNDRHQDASAAIHDAFDVARRQLEDVARRQRGDVKTHH
jgi:hypothetical protein